MRKNFCFFIIAPDGSMRCTAKYWATEKQKNICFEVFKNRTLTEYPGSSAGWKEIIDLEFDKAPEAPLSLDDFEAAYWRQGYEIGYVAATEKVKKCLGI
jgi:hypothetical protein